MHNHTGCISLTFLHCVFLNVFSKRLSRRMKSCIGCICLTFLQCAFSNVSSNCPRQWMHNHTGCNDLAFLRCGFSYVSSMWLPERKLYRTGCTFLTFQSLDPSLVQISKREERDNCSIWTRLMYICNWPLVLSYSKLKEWKWNSSGVDGEGLLCGKHQVQEAGDQSASAAIYLQHSQIWHPGHGRPWTWR